MSEREAKLKRVLTTTAWVVAMILPGGLPLLALWVAYKAARQRSTRTTPRKSAVSWVAPKALEAETVRVSSAGTCSITIS